MGEEKQKTEDEELDSPQAVVELMAKELLSQW
jgi:hypothetical protein